MKCCQCSHEAEYHKNPKTGANSKEPQHAFCAFHWEDAMRFAARDSLRRDNYADQLSTFSTMNKNIMRNLKGKYRWA